MNVLKTSWLVFLISFFDILFGHFTTDPERIDAAC